MKKRKENIFAIGAMGGSGTRVVAEIFMKLGIFMGDELNEANDNLFFTRLFKNPAWYNKATVSDFEKRFSIFRKFMSGERLNLSEIFEIRLAAETNPTFSTDESYSLNLMNLLHTSRNRKTERWGWKEPNTQIYIDRIAFFFPELKYVHVIRNGLDMAYSGNRQQLMNWGYLFKLVPLDNSDENEITKLQLEYWIRSNTRSIKLCEELMPQRFYLLNYDELCSNPALEVIRLLGFIGYQPNDELMRQLIAIPQKSDTANKYKQKDISIFSDKQLNEVEQLGFRI